MSAFLFGQQTGRQITRRRAVADAAAAGGAAPAQPTTKDKVIGKLGGLIPADILAFHLILLQATTKVEEKAPAPGKDKVSVTTITDEKALKYGFIALCILGAAFYIAGRIRSGERLDLTTDLPLMLVPPLAFVGWTALQRATAFDAIRADDGDRALIGIVAAGIAIAISVALGPKDPADEDEDEAAPAPPAPA